MPRGPKGEKRPRDFSQAAKLVVDIASGQVDDREPTPEEQGKDPAAVALGKRGGAKGGRMRASRLTPEQRTEAAKTAVRMTHYPFDACLQRISGWAGSRSHAEECRNFCHQDNRRLLRTGPDHFDRKRKDQTIDNRQSPLAAPSASRIILQTRRARDSLILSRSPSQKL
jgi:hypothetical protein